MEEENYVGIPESRIPELNKKYLEGLTDKQKDEIFKRWRLVKDFEDGNAVGSIIIDNVTVTTFNEFRSLSRKYFGNSDGPCLSALVQVFLIEKQKQDLFGGQNGRK